MKRMLLLLATILSCSTLRNSQRTMQCADIRPLLTSLQRLNLTSDWSELTRKKVEETWHRPVERRTADSSVFEDRIERDGCGCWQAAVYGEDRLRQSRVIRVESSREQALTEARETLLVMTPPYAENSSAAGPDDFRMYRWVLGPGAAKHRQLGFDFEATQCRDGWILSMTMTLFDA